MGTSRSAAELAGKLHRAASTVQATNRHAVEQSALFTKGVFERGAKAAGLTPGRPYPRASGAKWGVRYDIRGAQNPTALVRYVGPVHWAFFGTRPHVIVASGLAGRRRAQQMSGRIGAMSAFGGSNRGAFTQSSRALAAFDARAAEKGRRVRARKKALTTPKGPRAYAFHPGHAGRDAWPLTKRLVAQRVPVVFAEAHRTALIRAGFGLN